MLTELSEGILIFFWFCEGIAQNIHGWFAGTLYARMTEMNFWGYTWKMFFKNFHKEIVNFSEKNSWMIF